METETDGVKEKSEKGNVVFSKHNVLPSAKMLTFMRNQTFDVTASYADQTELAPGTDPFIGIFTISNIPAPADGGASKIKVKVRLDMDGLVSMDGAQALEEVEVEEEPKKDEVKKDDQPMSDAAPTAPADAPAQPEPANAGEATEGAAAAAPQKKKKIKKHDLTLTPTGLSRLSSSTLEKFKAAEFEMAAQDRHIKELQEKKNDLEAYIYSMRDRVNGGDLSEYIADSDKATLNGLMEAMENWLYSDEAEHANKSLFVSKLEELRKYGGPAEERFREADERPGAVSELQSAINEYAALAASTDAAYDHISAEDRGKVQNEVKQVTDWLGSKVAEQGAKRNTDPVAVTAREIRAKRDSLQFFCRPIMNKPKPAPPKPEPKPVRSIFENFVATTRRIMFVSFQDDKPAAAEPAAAQPEPAAAGTNGMDEGLD
jgi:heat shock protein 4